MGTLRIESKAGAPRDLSRERYDLARRNVLEPKSVCHAPFSALHVGATLAPCRVCTLDLGDSKSTTLAEGFTSEALQQMRERFKQYLVRRDECSRCIHHWEDEAPSESPAQAEYDRALPPVNGVAPRLRALSVDARAELPAARVDEIVALLPELDQVVVTCGSLAASGLARKLLDAVESVRGGKRPKLEVIAEGFVPAADALPAAVTAAEVALPLHAGRLSSATKTKLADLAAEFSERGAPFTVRTRLSRENWPDLREWLADVLACGAQPVVEPIERGAPGSLAELDADLIATLHGVLYRWSVELGIAGDEARGAAAFTRLLARLRHWQKLAAERTTEGPPLATPDLDHPLLRDENEARRLLQEFLRVYHHARVESWLVRLVQHKEFVRGARARLSLRLVALWLSCVFERNDVRPSLRAIYENPASAAALIAADKAALASSPATAAFASWHDGWLKALELEKQPRGPAPFEIAPPPAKAAAAAVAGRPQVTVVIPSYNHARFVGAAIDSALVQESASGLALRVLVVDDGSTDDTVAVARTRKDPRLTVRRNERNLGLGESLLRALRTIKTPYVAVLNSDDLFHPARVAKLVDALKERPRAAIAASLLAPIDADGRACTTADSSPVFDGKRVHDWLRWFETTCKDAPTAGDLLGALFERNFLVTSSNLVARRDFLLEHLKLWRDLEYCVDWQLFLAAAAQGVLRVVPEPLLAYRLHASNTVWFDQEREWRYYVELHRVVARTLELMLARDGREPEQRFAAHLELAASHLTGNGDVDWAGVYLGILLERLKMPSRAIRGEASKRWVQTLDAMRRMRLHVRDVVKLLGDNLSDYTRMRSERPFLRAARNQAEAVADELERLKWELQSALRERQNVEKLWHQAERERDHEVAGKGELYQRVGALEGEVAAARGETAGARRETEEVRREAAEARRVAAEKQRELEHFHATHGQLQTALQEVQRDHDQVRSDVMHALGSLHAGQDRAKEDLVQALKAVLVGHESVRAELTGALDQVKAERELIEGGLADVLHGVSRERDKLKGDATRERETLRTELERLHEEASTLFGELERSRADLEEARRRARFDLDAERTDALHRLSEERTRLVAGFDAEKAKLRELLDVERAHHASTVAQAAEAARQRLGEELAREAALRIELAEEAEAARAELLAKQEELLGRQAELTGQRDALDARRTELEAERARLEAEQASARAAALADAERQAREVERLDRLVNLRTRERDDLKRAPEFRLGHLVLNQLGLRSPLRAIEKGVHGARMKLAAGRLAAERKGLLGGGGGRPRVFSTICWNFPIYSQTFVYQELLQMERRGFDLRVVYSKLDPRDLLAKQFDRLWKLKRAMHLDRAVHRRDFQRYHARFPDRVEQLVQKLSAASGLSREALLIHDNFLQGFTYARLAEAWGAQYLHSYFFYDRSLMSLIAGEVLKLPRGISCYADHLLADYELKVVPLHMQTCDVVVATSARIKRELLSLAPETDPDKILVKPNAIDCTRFPVLPRAEPGANEPFRMVVTSRIEPKKGLVHLVEAVKLLRDQGVNVEAHFVGDVDKGVPSSENYKAELCDLITRLDLWGKVHLEGRQSMDGVRRFLGLCQLFVAPFVETASGDKDGIPTALVEAMATGIPSVVTDAGSILEVVDDRVDARVVPQRDPRALADAIRELLQDPVGRRHMGHKAAQKAREQFDVSVCEPRLHDRMRALLAARK